MRNFKSCLKGLLPFVRIARGRMLLCMLLGLLGVTASLSFVAVCKSLIDIATGSVDKPIMPFVIAMIGLLLAKLALRVIYNYQEGLNSINTQIKVRRSLYAHLLNSQWDGRETFHSGDAINRLEQDVSMIVDFCCSRLPSILITVFQLLAASAFLLVMAPKLLWILLVLMVVAVLGSRLFFNTLRSLTNSIRAKDSIIQAHLQETLQNRIVVLTISGARRMVERLKWLQEDLYGDTVKRLNYGAIARTFMNLGFTSGYAVAFLWGVFGVRSGAVTFGMMTAFLQLVGQVQRPVASLAKVVPNFIRTITSVERLMDLQDLPLEKEETQKHIENVPEIEVRQVVFSYPDQQKRVFDGFSTVFPAGGLTAIIGETGAGKSTLTRLLLALLKPQSGDVLVDGQPADVDLRCNFMYVP